MIISQETADKSLALIKMQKERIAELERFRENDNRVIKGLYAQNKALREALMKIITEQQKYNMGVMTVRSTEIAIRDAAKLLGQGDE